MVPLTSPDDARIVAHRMKGPQQNQRGLAIAAAMLGALLFACEAPEAVDGPPPPTPPPAASVDESPARPTIDLGSERKTALVDTFYPVPLAEGTSAAKTQKN